MNSRSRVHNRNLYLFLLKNGLISISVSLIIVQTLISLLQIHIHYLEKIPLFFFVLIIITIFFMIIFIQERKIRSKQEQLLAVIENSTQSLFILNKNKNIISLNDSGRELLDLQNHKVVNFCEVCSTYPGADKICDVSNCFLMNDKENPVELYIKNHHKELIPVQATISFYTTPDKQKGTVVGIQKVSEKRKEEHKEIEKMITHSIFQAQEKERKLISRELHDGIGQSLFGMLLHTDFIKSISEDKMGITQLEKLQQMISQTIEDIRYLSAALRPSTLDNHGLIATLKNHIRDFGQRFGIQINFTYKGSNERLPSAIETALYRIAQEALINAAKYSSAERIDVSISVDKDQNKVSLTITDFGKGVELTSTNRRGVGIYSMEERASILGGDFFINSKIGKGTQIQVNIPIV
ncbi:sensor histidine kinase [Neobacillus niacini]|uniref:sensor histidine kinase n=1 Tax=Neobacillus niacini TaxID=86668 RepID=UPI002FFEA267